jgi:hypothetical protein
VCLFSMFEFFWTNRKISGWVTQKSESLMSMGTGNKGYVGLPS